MLKEIIKNEKEKMNKIRFIVNYYIALPFALLAILSGIISVILMDLDEEKYLPVFIAWLIMIGVCCVLLLIATPIIRKKEILIECAKKDFDLRSVEDQDEFEFSDSEQVQKIKLSSKGIIIGERLYDVHSFDVTLIIKNYLLLVDLTICFTRKDINEEQSDNKICISLTKELIYALKKFNVNVRNQDELDFIINNKEIAFKQILTYGKLKK
ncbi:MAG: hypothetical protein K0Q49_2455 [Haloplasmataceae bacterium]|nr:hypothetical protein [Haloplasmataceae bacterium]